MSKNPFLTGRVDHYVTEVISREGPVLRRLREETAKLPMAVMQISPDQGAFLALLLKLTGARRVLEIGTFTGYSATAMALALPEDGRLIACDISEEWTDVARRTWQEAGVAHKVELRLAPAQETLKRLAAEKAPAFDFVFIDADKAGYDAYYEAVLPLLRTGGLIAFDNMLWSGRVADPSEKDADTAALRALNAKIAADKRVDMCLVTVADGVMLVRKR